MNRVSFIISSRNEERTLPFTVTQLMLDCYQSGIEDYEFLISDNGSTDNTTKFWNYAFNNSYAKQADHQLSNELKYSPRGMVSEGKIRFIYDAIFSNVGARHKTVEYARYENLIFVDAHIQVKPNTIKYALETLNKYGGIVHMPVAWLGASIDRPHPGMQYTYKIGEKIWGTWNYAQVVGNAPFYIPLSGHCFLAVKKKEYQAMGGYDTHQRVYGGGENYLDTLFWMLGSNVMVDPRGLVLHLSAGRGYSYDINSLVHNMILTAYTLGDHKWAERILVTYLDKAGTNKAFLYDLYAKTIKEGQEKRDFIEANKKMTLEEVLAIDKPNDCDGPEYKAQAHAKRVWDIKNDELHGHHISFVVVFQDWLERLKTDEAKNFFANSPHQK